ncbi:MAG: PilW family protein [Gammaproteobacteria bacterium]
MNCVDRNGVRVALRLRRGTPRVRLVRSGLSLVELMVALVIGSILMIGVITLFVSSRANYRFNTELSQAQDTARFAMDTLLADLRMAGYFGCGGKSVTIENLTNGGVAPAATALNSTENGLEGINDAATNWSPSGAPTSAMLDGTVHKPGTDAVTIRRMAGPELGNIGVSASGTTLTFQSAEFGDVEDDFNHFRIAAIANCKHVDVFHHDAVDGVATPRTVTASTDLSQPYDHIDNQITTIAAPFIARRYFIGIGDKPAVSNPGTPAKDNPADWIPILYRTEYRRGTEQEPEEMFQGVEDLQFQFGVDTNDNGTPDEYHVAGDAKLDSNDEWAQVVAVRMAMLVRSREPVAEPVEQVFFLLDKKVEIDEDDDDYDVNGRYRRRVFTATVTLRNL